MCIQQNGARHHAGDTDSGDVGAVCQFARESTDVGPPCVGVLLGPPGQDGVQLRRTFGLCDWTPLRIQQQGLGARGPDVDTQQ